MKDKIKERQIEKIRNHYKNHFDVQLLLSEIGRLKGERDKLIEGLRFYERMARGREVNDGGRRARTLLAEIGVTVE